MSSLRSRVVALTSLMSRLVADKLFEGGGVPDSHCYPVEASGASQVIAPYLTLSPRITSAQTFRPGV